MTISRLSSKNQVTIPKTVRQAIGLKSGDLISYEVKNGEVTFKPVEPLDEAFYGALSGALDEWLTPEDEAAFGNL